MRLQVSTLLLTFASTYAYKRNRFGSNIPAAFSLPVEIATSAKDELLSFSKQQFAESKTGVFITDYESKQKFKKLVAELEAVCDEPTASSQTTMLGDWKLLCTIATPTEDISARLPKIDKKENLPFGLKLPTPPEFLTNTLDPLQDKVKESVEVIQRIRKTDEEGSDVLNRVDNVIQFTPFTLENILDNMNLNLNPLEVSKSKVTLIHSADVQSISPLLRTKLVLKGVVLTVAGTSQYLEPDGADLLGLNVPLGDLFNFGSFDTTYVDDNFRVSRSKVGLVEQLRVFERLVEIEDDAEVVEETEELPTAEEEPIVSEVDDVVVEEEEETDEEETDEASTEEVDTEEEGDVEEVEVEEIEESEEEEDETTIETTDESSDEASEETDEK